LNRLGAQPSPSLHEGWKAKGGSRGGREGWAGKVERNKAQKKEKGTWSPRSNTTTQILFKREKRLAGYEGKGPASNRRKDEEGIKKASKKRQNRESEL